MAEEKDRLFPKYEQVDVKRLEVYFLGDKAQTFPIGPDDRLVDNPLPDILAQITRADGTIETIHHRNVCYTVLRTVSVKRKVTPEEGA
jgi:hypothetical protein